MSKESATHFLETVARDSHLQETFHTVATPQEFVQLAKSCGYNFTTEELRDVIKEHSQGVTMRRQTGVWKWLRSVPWTDSMNSGHIAPQVQEA